jgi:hypothetical protein
MTELEAAAKILRCWPAAALSLQLNPMMNAAVRKDSFFFLLEKKDSGQAAASLCGNPKQRSRAVALRRARRCSH